MVYMKKNKIIISSLALFSTFLAACSSGPSESDISAAIERQLTEEMKQQAKVMKALNTFLPGSMQTSTDQISVSVKDLVIEDQQEQENGDFVSKVTMVVVNGDETKKMSMRVTTSEVDGQLKILENGSEIL